MNQRRLAGPAVFAAGFVTVVLMGKGVGGHHPLASVVPNGIYLQGAVLGALNGLLAIGLVLIYRTNRIVNFAQGELGAFGAVLAQELAQRYRLPYVLAVLVGIAAATVASAFIEFAIIRRFRNAPRLILTVATIGVAQLLGFVEIGLPIALNKNQALGNGIQFPLHVRFTFGQVIFRGDHVVILVVAPLIIAGLIWFLTRTGYGLAARAAAENEDRARLLGVRTRRVSLLVWTLAGFLSAVTAILQLPINSGFAVGVGVGDYSLLLHALAAAVIARMENLTVAFTAGVLLMVGQQVLYNGTSKSGPDDGLFLLVIVAALLIQRRRMARIEASDSTWQAVQEVRPIPTELRDLAEVKWVRAGLMGLGAALLIGLPWIVTASRTNLLSVIFIYSMIGISLVILTGWSGNVSLGQWAIVGVGALVANRLAAGSNPQDFFVVCLFSGACGALVAVAVGLPALRIKGLFLGVTTLAFAQAAGNWFFHFKRLLPSGTVLRPKLFGFWDTTSERQYYFVCLIALVAAMAMGRNLRRARLGRMLIGVRDNERQAQSLGASPTRLKLSAFAFSGFIAALAGALYTYHQQALDSQRFLSPTSIIIFSMVVIGGMGSLGGAVLGAAYVKGTQYFLTAQFQLLATGLGILLLLLVFPGGLGQLVFGARDRYLRWVARRRGVLVPSLVADRRVIDLAAIEREGERPTEAADTLAAAARALEQAAIEADLADLTPGGGTP
ncbi:MAG: ABC transporter permease [Acidimicrobiales bacterium]